MGRSGGWEVLVGPVGAMGGSGLDSDSFVAARGVIVAQSGLDHRTGKRQHHRVCSPAWNEGRGGRRGAWPSFRPHGTEACSNERRRKPAESAADHFFRLLLNLD